MNGYALLTLLAAAIAAWLLQPCTAATTTAAAEPPSVPRYDVFELSLTTDETFADPFVDARITADFVAPDKHKVAVGGFYYGNAKWIVRFVPDQLGLWSYTARLVGKKTVTASGQLQCIPSDRPGFVRLSATNPYRLQYDSGKPFYPIGIHPCSMFHPDFDGPDPAGQWQSTDVPTWCKAFTGAVNLHRLQLGLGDNRGCAVPILKGIADNAVQYDLDLAARLDDAYRLHRQYGFSQILILYQDMSLWGNAPTPFGPGRDTTNYKNLHAPNLRLQENYIRYVVARYAPFVDIWEIFNEDSFAPDDYLEHLAAVIRAADPYGHIITTNYEKPLAPWCQLVTPHEYIGIPAGQTDVYLAKEFARFKSFGKPVLYTEFGNQGTLPNFDPIKWRVATWTAFMNESGLVFWGMSGRKVPGSPTARGNSNAYLGPESRQYFRILQQFTADLPLDLRPVAGGYTEQQQIRTYALSNSRITVLYVHHYADHATSYQYPDRLQVVTGPGQFQFKWIDPATGQTVREGSVNADQIYAMLEVPPVTIDLACRLDRSD